jgi:hypothetical protein
VLQVLKRAWKGRPFDLLCDAAGSDLAIYSVYGDDMVRGELELDLQKQPLHESSFEQILQKFANLPGNKKRLQITGTEEWSGGSPYTHLSAEASRKVLVGALSTGVEELVIKLIMFTSSYQRMLIEPLPQIVRLRHLELDKVTMWGDGENGSWVPCMLPRLTGLQSLQLQGDFDSRLSPSHTKDVQQVSAAMRALTGLTRLQVVHAVPACDLVSAVSALSQLQDVHLEFDLPSEHVTHALGNALGQLPALSSLALRVEGDEDDCDDALCQLLRECIHRGMSSLQRLHLLCHCVNDRISRCLNDVLCCCANIQTMLIGLESHYLMQHARDVQEVSHWEQQSLRLDSGSISGHRSVSSIGGEVVRVLLPTQLSRVHSNFGCFITPGVIGISVDWCMVDMVTWVCRRELQHLISDVHVEIADERIKKYWKAYVFGRRL